VTIAVSVKINDGLVLATDSASTLLGISNNTLGVVHVYNNANKLFNLPKGFPVGAVTWGSGTIGQTSTSTVLKDLRHRLTGHDQRHPKWTLNPTGYSVEEVARRLREYVFDELYVEAYKNTPVQQQPEVGFIVAGYSPDQPMADEFQIDIKQGQCVGPRKLREQHQSGVTWAGDTEALNRMVNGCSQLFLAQLSQQFHIEIPVLQNATASFQQQTPVQFVLPQMPLQDAIDVAEFFVEMTIKFHHHKIGPPTVGGPIELAAISKHEGFRWVRRKYYFKGDLNPQSGAVSVPERRREGKEGDNE
jgi:hypothetical protein